MLWRPLIKQHQGACIVREQVVKGYDHTIPTDSFSCRPKKLQVNGKDILFGIIECEDEIFGNHILLLEKQYLYSCRQNKHSPSIRVLNSKIKHCFLIETMIAKSDNKLETHDMKCSKYKVESHTIISPLSSFINFSCKQRRIYWGVFLSVCNCVCAMCIWLVFFSFFFVFVFFFRLHTNVRVTV